MSGIIHVGAHRGEEVDSYLAWGLKPVLCFEPQQLNRPEWQGGDVRFVPLALGDRTGTMELRVPRHLHDSRQRDTQSASALPLIDWRACDIGWTPPTDYDIERVSVFRFDEWANVTGLDVGVYDHLAIDVQGMELQVLRGFGVALNLMNEVIVECSEEPIYEGGASAGEVRDHLAGFGLRQVTAIPVHGDVLFRRFV